MPDFVPGIEQLECQNMMKQWEQRKSIDNKQIHENASIARFGSVRIFARKTQEERAYLYGGRGTSRQVDFLFKFVYPRTQAKGEAFYAAFYDPKISSFVRRLACQFPFCS